MHLYGGDEVNIVPFVYPRGTVSVSSLVSFSSVGSSSKPSRPYLPLSLGARHIQEYFNNPKMVCSYRSSCLDLPVALVYFKMKGCELRLHHVL